MLAGTIAKQGDAFDVCSDRMNTTGDDGGMALITALGIRDMLDVRDGISVIPGLSHHDISIMLHNMCLQ